MTLVLGLLGAALLFSLAGFCVALAVATRQLASDEYESVDPDRRTPWR